MKFRLSTAIVMMLVAAVLLWLNVRGTPHDSYLKVIDFEGAYTEFGFPFAACYRIKAESFYVPPDNFVPAFTLYAWQWLNMGLDILFFITTVLGIGFVMERYVFRTTNNANRIEARE